VRLAQIRRELMPMGMRDWKIASRLLHSIENS
jgi:hypothetical protein